MTQLAKSNLAQLLPKIKLVWGRLLGLAPLRATEVISK